jgi:hypothetical protein
MLAILSEINCLNTLKGLGIYPDAFYTDYNLFKNQVITLKDVTAVIILAGTCSFNKKHTIEFCKILRKYRKDPNMSIRHVYIISDSEISNLDNYYKFTGDISDLTIMNKYKVVEKDTQLFDKLRSYGKNDTKLFLSDYDKGDSAKAREVYAHRGNSEDDYKELIKVPDVKKMLATN